MAFTPTSPEADEALEAGFPMHRKEVPPLALVQHGETAQIADAETADPQTQRLGRARGWRSVTFTPLMSQGTFIGFIVCTRREPGVFADHHVQLLRTFADQAVIAIENTRLFNETQQALERQTATADVLKVIASSPSDVQPVFEAIASSAKRLLGGILDRGAPLRRRSYILPPSRRRTPKPTRRLQAPSRASLRNSRPFRWSHTARPFSSPTPKLKRCPTRQGIARASRFPQHAVHAPDERRRARRHHQRDPRGARRVRSAACSSCCRPSPTRP